MIVQINPYLQNFCKNNIKFQRSGGAKPKPKAKPSPKPEPESDNEEYQSSNIFYTEGPTPLRSSSVFQDEDEKKKLMVEFDVRLTPKYYLDHDEFIKNNHDKIIDLDANNMYKEPEDDFEDMSESYSVGSDVDRDDEDIDAEVDADAEEADADDANTDAKEKIIIHNFNGRR